MFRSQAADFEFRLHYSMASTFRDQELHNL